jgi:hypothetical protein
MWTTQWVSQTKIKRRLSVSCQYPCWEIRCTSLKNLRLYLKISLFRAGSRKCYHNTSHHKGNKRICYLNRSLHKESSRSCSQNTTLLKGIKRRCLLKARHLLLNNQRCPQNTLSPKNEYSMIKQQKNNKATLMFVNNPHNYFRQNSYLF